MLQGRPCYSLCMNFQHDLQALVDILKEKAHDIARTEQHSPVLFLVGPEKLVPILAQFGSEEERFAVLSRRAAQSINACAAVFITEAYLTFVRGPESKRLDDEELLAYAREQKLERQDTLLVSVEMKGQPSVFYAAKIGVPDGVGARKIGEFKLMDGLGQRSGRFIDLLGELEGGEVV